MTYDLRPMLATPTTGTKGRTGIPLSTVVDTYVLDEKIDGVRMFAVVEDGTVRLVNRSGNDRTRAYPELHDVSEILDCVLDGEVVACDSRADDPLRFSFEATAIRDKQQAPTASHLSHYPAVYVAFDVLYIGGIDVRQRPLEERRRLLRTLVSSVESLHLTKDDVGRFPYFIVPSSTDYATGNMDFYERVVRAGGEGVIAKHPLSVYKPGRQGSWLKFKATHRLTCVPVGYEPGNGARSDFGAMHLALVGPDGPVQVGRVGTGFTAAEIADLKARLDAKALFAVEIECLNVTKTGQLRFPVYKGIRTDLSVVDATLDQLDTIPRC